MKKIHCRTGPSYVRERRIRIAVLDTGVDSTHPFIKAAIKHNRIKRVESFVEGVKGTHDSHGHGTHIAALLLEIAPDSQLYIAKVAEGGKIPANHKIADVSMPRTMSMSNRLKVTLSRLSDGL
jgi:subtilisin family serine protease